MCKQLGFTTLDARISLTSSSAHKSAPRREHTLFQTHAHTSAVLKTQPIGKSTQTLKSCSDFTYTP